MKRSLAHDHVISRYRIAELLGAGGMGEVYRAWDSTLERTVALKVLPPQLVQNHDRVRRFVQEAKAASSLNHPHIITIHDVGEDAGVHFIAMELIDGETLRTKINGGASLRDLIGWLAQAADGLAKAHAAGIVHRDLKPDNIMITRDGYAKVLDFGLAKLIEPSSPSTAAHEVTQVRHDDATREGFVVGTIGYMSPEQVQGQPVDHRSDVFSFGAMLYEASTRRRAFAADSDVDLMHKIVHDQPEPIDRINPSTPAELRRIVRRCLAKHPDQRIQSMKDLAIELHEIHDEFETLTTRSDSDTHSMPTVVVPILPRRRPWVAIAGAVVALLLLGGGIAAWRIRARPAAPLFTLDRMQIRKLTTSGRVKMAAISPDGKYLAYESDESGKFGIHLRQVATGSDLQTTVPQEEDFQGLSFSPDSNYLYFAARETTMSEYSVLQSIPTLGGTTRKLLFDVDTSVTFSPDGTRIAFVRGAPDKREAHLVMANADGTNPVVRYVSKGVERLDFYRPSWSPDGKHIAALTGWAADLKYIAVIDVATGAVSHLGESWGDLTSVAWLNDGSGVIVTAAKKDGANLQIWFVSYPEGRSSRIFSDLNDYNSATLTADARTIAAVQLDMKSSLYVSSPNGDGAKLLTGPELGIFSVAAAHDKTIYTLYKPGANQLWTIDANGTRTQLTNMTPAEFPSVSRDGRTVLFSGRKDGVPHIFAVDVDGNNLRQLTSGGGEWYPSIAPDGTWFVYSGTKGTIMRQAITGGVPQLVSENSFGYAKVAPDGKSVALMAFTPAAGGKMEIVLKDVPVGGGPSRSTIPWLADRGWDWTPAGEIAYFNESTPRTLWSIPIAGGPPRKLLELPSADISAFAFSADGKQLYTSRTNKTQDAILLTDFR